MVKLFEQQFPYSHPWSTTTIGLWTKYPNPHATHVLTVDTLSRSVDPSTGVLRTERLIGCRQGVPKWIMRVLGVTEDAFVREVIFVDPVSRMTSMVSFNLSLSQYMQCIELISNSPHQIPSSSSSSSSTDSSTETEQTLFTQRAIISSPPSGHPSLSYIPSSGDGLPLTSFMRRSLKQVGQKLEQSGVERFSMNAETGRMGFEGVLREVGERLKGRKYARGNGWPNLGREDSGPAA